jgi:hypothetical protein
LIERAARLLSIKKTTALSTLMTMVTPKNSRKIGSLNTRINNSHIANAFDEGSRSLTKAHTLRGLLMQVSDLDLDVLDFNSDMLSGHLSDEEEIGL